MDMGSESPVVKHAEEKTEAGPLQEYVVASRLRKNRAFHRALLLLRVLLFILFIAYRVHNMYGSCTHDDGELGDSCRFNGELEVVALVCELYFCVIFLLSITSKWFMVERVTYPDKLRKRFEELPSVDVFVTTADPSKESPIITMNTILSTLLFDYPTHKISCYVSDDGGSLLTLWCLKETVAFAKSNWLPFCTKFSPHIHPRAPRPYFSCKGNFDRAMKCGFSNDWLAIKKQYLEFEAKLSSMTKAYCKSKNETLEIILNQLLASSTSNYQLTTYSSWALNYDPHNHSSYCEVLIDKPPPTSSMDLPSLVYLSREKHPTKKHHFKAGAMNALLRVSGIMTNAPFILNLDCDMYVNEPNSLLQAMCVFLENRGEQANVDKIGFVQFPQCFEGVDNDDIYGSTMAAAIEILLKGMDGAQGPAYCGTGCVFKRGCLYAQLPKSSPSQWLTNYGEKLGESFGCSQNLILNVQKIISCKSFTTDSLNQDSLIMESNTLIDCDYEEKTRWGDEVGLIYGSATEDLMTGMKIHARGWRSAFCMPSPPAFLGCAPSTCEDSLTTRKRWSMGMLEILFSSNSPIFFQDCQGLSLLQRTIYIYIYGSVLTSFPIFIYSLLPALSILGKKQIFPKVAEEAILFPLGLAMCMYISNIYENKVVGIGLKQWWNSERMEYIVANSSNIFASFEVLKKKILGLSETTFTITPKNQCVQSTTDNEYGMEEIDDTPQETPKDFVVNSTLPIFVPIIILVLFNIFSLIVVFMRILSNPNPLSLLTSAEVACSIWILFMLYPFTKGFFLWIVGQSGPLVLSSSTILYASLIVGPSLILILYS